MLLLAFLSGVAPSLALVAHRRAALPSRLGPPASGTGAWPSSSFQTPPPLHPSSKFAHRAPFRPSSNRGRSGTVPSRLAASSPTSSAPPPSSSSSDAKLRTALAATALVVLDVQFRSLFRRYSVPFPSSLAGCGALFASMLLLDAFGGRGEGFYRALNPGATVLAKWLPVFFVPSLIALPLASGLGDAREVLKLLAVIVGGFFFTLFTTAWSVLGVRKLTGGGSGSDSAKADVVQTERVASTTPVTNPPPKAFGKTLFRSLKALAWIAGISTVALVKTSTTLTWIGPMQSAFLLFVTLSTFVFGANLPKPFTKVVHPLVTCTGLTWLAANVLARLTGSTFLDVLRSYKVGTLAPMSAGAGDVLLFLLGPAVVALACQMYGRKELVRENLAEVGTSTAVSSVGGLYGTAAAVRLLGMANPAIRLSLLSRNITSPLAMAVASILGADVSLAVTIVVVTGLFGANFGASILDAFGIKDAVARGLGIGAAAHGLGTAAFANEGDAFPFAAIAMALTASAITVLVSVPGVKRSVMNLALGV